MSRRSRGEGSVFFDGRYWRGAIRIDGKRRWRTARTRAEVVRKLDELKHGGSASREKFGAFLDRWLAYIKPNVRANTYAGYEQIVRIHLKPCLAEVRLQALRADHAEDLLRRVRGMGRSPRTVSLVRTVAIMALGMAERWELVGKNWFKLSGAPKLKKKSSANPLHPDEARALLTAVETHKDGALMALAAHSGARRGEVMGAKWADIDLIAGTWRICRSIQRVQSKLMEFPPKTEKGYRTLKVPAEVIALLKAHRREQLETRMKAGAQWKDEDWCFTGAHGQLLQPEYIADSFKALLKAAQIQTKHCFKDLRHSLVCFFLAKGTPIKDVQHFMGHSTAAMTLDTYGHLFADSRSATSPLE